MYPNSSVKKAGARFVAAAWLAAVAGACDSPPVSKCFDGDCLADDASVDRRRDSITPSADGAPVDSGPTRNVLCGRVGCFPGNWNACGSLSAVPFTTSTQPTDAASETDVIIVTDSATDATIDVAADGADAAADVKADDCQDDATRDSVSPDVTVDAGSSDASVADGSLPPIDSPPIPDASSDGGLPPTPDASGPIDAGRADVRLDLGTEEPRIAQSCYIRPAGTGVTTECAPAGMLGDGDACNDSHDCSAVHECVEVDQKAACRPVVCSVPADCSKWTYYQEAPLRANGVTRREFLIPVCVPTDNCVLLEPNQCPAGKVCAIVGTRGDTTCLEPGSAKIGEPCDDDNACTEGLLCSKLVNQCVKLCHVDPQNEDCRPGICQGGNRSLPDGFGICVGPVDGG
jgi:hypothetical protein